MVIKLLSNVGRRMDEHKNFSKATENIRNQLEVITELKNTVEGFSSRKDKTGASRQSLQTKQWKTPRQSSKMKRIKRREDNLRDFRNYIKWDKFAL